MCYRFYVFMCFLSQVQQQVQQQDHGSIVNRLTYGCKPVKISNLPGGKPLIANNIVLFRSSKQLLVSVLTFEWLFEMTWRPSRVINLASYVVSGASEDTQGHRQV